MLLSSNIIKKCAKNVGFDLCGVIKSGEVAEYDDFFMSWITHGKNAGLGWADNNHDLRKNPSNLHLNTKSIIVLGLNYHKKGYSRQVSMLANGVDYHYVVKQKLGELTSEIEKIYNIELNAKACVDSAPITEKYWAFRAGLGWLGRNSLLVNKEFGSFFVLGELLLDCEFDSYDTPSDFNGCEGCRRCEASCPTSALSDKTVDARRCLAYLTIEWRKEFDSEQAELIKKSRTQSFFGCDICQNVCPWNIKALNNLSEENYVKIDKQFCVKEFKFDKNAFSGLSNSEFKREYSKTALFRTGKKKILINIDAIN